MMTMCHPGERERLVADLLPSIETMLNRPHPRGTLAEFPSHLKLELKQSIPSGRKKEGALPLPGIEGWSPVGEMKKDSHPRERKVRESLTFMVAHQFPGSM